MAINQDLLRKAESIERISAEIYRVLAQRFARDNDAAQTFSQLETEELEHANRVHLFASQLLHDPRLVTKDEPADGETNALLAEAEAALRRVQSPEPLDLGEALDLCVHLEAHLDEGHAHVVAASAHPQVSRFFAMLSKEDRLHRELLASPQRRNPRDR
jgi:rubrerythrin